MLVGCVSFVSDPIGCVSCRRTRLLWLPPRVAFFSHQRRTLLLLVYVFSFWHHSLSLRRRPLLFRQQHSLYLLRRSLGRSVFSDVPAGLSRSLPPAARALRIALTFSPQKVGAAVGRPAACMTMKGARANVDRAVLRSFAAAATPPPILLLGQARLVESPHQGGN
jgi:hypothetical protein